MVAIKFFSGGSKAFLAFFTWKGLIDITKQWHLWQGFEHWYTNAMAAVHGDQKHSIQFEQERCRMCRLPTLFSLIMGEILKEMNWGFNSS